MIRAKRNSCTPKMIDTNDKEVKAWAYVVKNNEWEIHIDAVGFPRHIRFNLPIYKS